MQILFHKCQLHCQTKNSLFQALICNLLSWNDIYKKEILFFKFKYYLVNIRKTQKLLWGSFLGDLVATRVLKKLLFSKFFFTNVNYIADHNHKTHCFKLWFVIWFLEIIFMKKKFYFLQSSHSMAFQPVHLPHSRKIVIMGFFWGSGNASLKLLIRQYFISEMANLF